MVETFSDALPEATGQIRTFLIADVRGYTRFTVEHGDEAAARLAVRFAAITRDVISTHGGKVIELRGDEALAVFASARQALRGAVALGETFVREMAVDTAMPIKVGIGLDAGEAVPVEGGFRGGALNLAARLCSLAGPGEVLASEGVTHLARKLDGLQYADRGAVQLKGFDDPVRVVEVRTVSQAHPVPDATAAVIEESGGRDLPIGGYLGSLPANRVVGRGPELARSADVIETVVKGTGRLLLLSGEPGAGKTRLAQEITLNLRNRGFLIAAGRCYEPRHAIPFYPFVELLTALYTAAPVEIRQEVPKKWSHLAHVLPALGLTANDTGGTQDQQRLYWSVTGFVQALAQKEPVALLLDDLHWADAASLELLQHLARHTRGDRILLLGTYRDTEVNRRHPLEATLRDLQREDLIERLEVRRLGREETRELIAAVLDVEVGDEFTDLLYRRTEGNPFFVQQVLHTMVERGDVYRKEDGWDRKAIEELEVPESVRSVVGQRLSRLTVETQEVLQEAAVLGQTFSFDDLEAMSGRSESELEVALDEAIAASMVRETGRDGYAFDHALTQGSLYAELSSRRRRRLHRAAGEAIEALPEHKRESRTAELAWHFLEGEDSERALHWSVIAGDVAERMFAHRDAEHHYRIAVELAEETENRALAMTAREKLGIALSLMARFDKALAVDDMVVNFYREQSDVEGEIRVTAEIGWILFEQGRRDEGIERLKPVLERWKRNPVRSSAAASLHVALANFYWAAGWMEDGLALVERAIELATAVGDDGLVGIAESRRGVFLQGVGRLDDALHAYTRSIPLLEAAGEVQMLQRTLNNRPMIYLVKGQTAEVWAGWEQALEVARRIGEPTTVAWSLGVLARFRWAIDGDWNRCRPYLDEIMRLEPRIRGTRASGHIAAAAWLRLVAGNDPSALSDLEGLANVAENAHDVSLWMWTQQYLAEWEMLQGREKDALERYSVLLEYAGTESQYRPIVEQGLARACVACGELDRAESLIARLEQGDRLSWWAGGLEWQAIRAQLRAAQERWDEARTDFEEAIDHMRSRSIVLGEAEIAHAYGEMLARQGEITAARERFEQSLHIFRRMNALPYIQRTEQALATLADRENLTRQQKAPD